MIFTIVRPMFGDIRDDQAEIGRYDEAIEAAGQVNARLSELRARMESFSAEELAALDAYVPGSVDPLSISRDIASIAEQNDLIVISLGQAEQEQSETEEVFNEGEEMFPGETGAPAAVSLAAVAEAALTDRRFEVSVLGSYESIKAMLADLERNEYPLRLVGLTFAPGEGSNLLSANLTIETYALAFES